MNIANIIDYFNNTPRWASTLRLAKDDLRINVLKRLIEITSFLPIEGTRLQQRAWHIINNNYKIPTCLICDNVVKWDKQLNNCYKLYCSKKCNINSGEPAKKRRETCNIVYGCDHVLKNDAIKQKLKNTNIARYGTEFALHNVIVAEKSRETMLNRYGVENASHSPELRQRRTDTILKKYGVENAGQSEIVKDRIKTTNLIKYGVASVLSHSVIKEKIKISLLKLYDVDNPLKNEQIKSRVRATNQERYGFDYGLQNEEVKAKKIATNQERYGFDYGLQNEEVKAKGKVANNLKYGVDYHTQAHINIDNLKLSINREWLINQHHDNKMPLYVIANNLGIDATTICDRLDLLNIEKRRFGSSYEERQLSEFIQYHSTSEIKICSRLTITPYELDIYIPDKNIAIEYHGLFWHSELYKDNNYHNMKHDMCKQKNIKLFQIFEDEWIDHKALVMKKLLYFLGVTEDKKIFARKCKIETIDGNKKELFFNNNHIQGNGSSSINYGLYYDTELVAAIGFIKNSDHYILNRYATSCNVAGGFTKLLTYFEKQFNYPKIITFADLRWSEGDLYKNNGFVLDKKLKPDYYWTKGTKRFHKFNFRHSRLKDKLAKYDPNLSESENMHNNNWWKIYDAGKLRFIKNRN